MNLENYKNQIKKDRKGKDVFFKKIFNHIFYQKKKQILQN